MNLKDFIRRKFLDQALGDFAIIGDAGIPAHEICIIGDTQSGKITLPEGNFDYLEFGEMLAETLEFLERKKRSHILSIVVNSDNVSKIEQSLRAFIAEDPSLEIEKEWEDDDAA